MTAGHGADGGTMSASPILRECFSAINSIDAVLLFSLLSIVTLWRDFAKFTEILCILYGPLYYSNVLCN